MVSRLGGRLVPRRYATSGLAVAALFVCFSLTPSLLPRAPAFQGLISGVVAAVGYGLGVLGGWALGAARRRLPDRVARWEPGSRAGLVSRGAVLTVAAVAIVTMLVLGGRWQRQASDLVDEARARPFLLIVGPGLQIAVVGVAVFVIVVGLSRGFVTISRRLARRLPARVPEIVAGVLAAALIAVVVAAAVDQVVAHRVLAALDESFALTNRGTPDDVERTTSRLRSGGPGSFIPWEDLGYEGRAFVGRGPTAAELSAFTGRPADEPIRVYGGLRADEDAADLAADVVRELERTGAFDRQVLCVAVPTGRGWINEDAADALEYLYAGDTAIASMQYSYLPSPLAFLVDPLLAEQAGEELFDQIHRRWSQLPATRRPRLLVFGESLGSTGIQAAFRDITDVADRTQGALLVGPPHSNELWSGAVNGRDAGSPMVLPVYESGRNVRFASITADLTRPGTAWQDTKIVFLQHASDPIVWWTPSLLFRRPDWLEEPRGRDVNPAMRWYPVVTFWQVTADMAVANGPPAGHGHRYGDFAQIWSSIAAPPGWTTADTERLSAHLART